MQTSGKPPVIYTGQHVFFGALGTTYKVLSESVGGSVAVIEHTVEPKRLGAPMHKHTHEDEISYVLEGQLHVVQDGDVQVVNPGEYIVKPRGRFHTFWNTGDTKVRFVEMITPGHFETYFAEMEPLLQPGRPPEMEKLWATAAKYGLMIDPVAADEIVEKYKLIPLE